MYGYAGRILRVDLTRGEAGKEPLDSDLARRFLGGTGYASWLLYHEVGPEVDPLGPHNKLYFFTGPFTGTMWPQGNRYVVTTRSPLTGIWGEAHAAGHWAPALKFAGYDGLVVEGASPRPVYILVEDGRVEIRDAGHLWGKNVHETEDILLDAHGDDCRVASIGPAGENLVLVAAIVNDRDRVAARCGVGAVMGAKRLKAICVRGTGGVEVADRARYPEFCRRMIQKLLDDPIAGTRVVYGTAGLMEIMSDIGRVPTWNLRSGVFPGARRIGGRRLRQDYLIKPRADFACAQRCGRYVEVREGRFRCRTGGPEFETLAALGSRCGVDDLEAVIYAGYLCNVLGLDTIGAGAVISWAMEAWERGLLPRELVGDLDLSWGNADTMVELVRRLAYRQGLGDFLANGSLRAARELGPEAEKLVMHVKGMEIAGQEPRGQKSMGLAMATSARGADHLYAFPVLDEGGFDEEIRRVYGPQYMPEMADRLSPVHKGHMVYVNENWAAVVESVGACKYGTMVPPTLGYEEVAEGLALTCGMDFSVADLEKLGERVVNLQRMYNVRLGLRRAHDTLPERLLKEPAPDGPARGHVVELDYMLDEYYRERGWTPDGIPTRERLQELGLPELVRDLEGTG